MTDDLDPRDAAIARLLAETPVKNHPQDLERALTAYRNSRAHRGARRLSRQALRLGTVGTVTVLAGSLAAGYAAALPYPVQRVAHHLLARVGVPAPVHRHSRAPGGHALQLPTPTTTGRPERSLRDREPGSQQVTNATSAVAASWSRTPDGRLRLHVHALSTGTVTQGSHS